MRLTLLIFIVIFFNRLYGLNSNEDWLDNFLKAEEFVNQQNLELAIDQYNLAINAAKDQFFLYVKRGKTFEKMKRYSEAFRDFDFVINQPTAEVQDLIPSLWGRARIFLYTDDIDNVMKDYEKAKMLDPDFPKIESNDRVLVWRNINPQYLTNSFKDQFAGSMTRAGICRNKEDVSFNERGICIVKKTAECSCQKILASENFKNVCDCCDCCEHEKNPCFVKTIQRNNNPTKETDCRYWCDRVYASSMVMCSAFETLKCKAVCAGVVEACKQGCHNCCAGDGFYKNCVKPFENFMERVGCEDNIW